MVAGGRGLRWEGKMCLGIFLRERLVHSDLNPFSLHFKNFCKIYDTHYRCGISGFFQMNETFFILRL